jgi:hypothetical protein
MSPAGTMRAAVAIGIVGILTACAGETSPPTRPSIAVASVSVSGTAPGMRQTAQFSAAAKAPNTDTQDVTLLATWSSSDPSVATVSSSGIVTGVRDGEADVIATYQGVSGKSHITLPIYAGIWTGTYKVDQCTSIDPPGLLPLGLCYSMFREQSFKFTLSQSGRVVTGTGNSYIFACGACECRCVLPPANLAMSGTTAPDDTLSITGTGPDGGFQVSMTFMLRRASPTMLAGTVDAILTFSGVQRATLTGTLSGP